MRVRFALGMGVADFRVMLCAFIAGSLSRWRRGVHLILRRRGEARRGGVSGVGGVPIMGFDLGGSDGKPLEQDRHAHR